MRARHLGLAAILGVIAGTQAEGQVSGSAAVVASQPRSTIAVGALSEEIGGTWTGVIVRVGTPVVGLSVTGLGGQLTALNNSIALARDGGEIGVAVRLSPVPFVGLTGGYTVRRFTSAAGVQDWNVPHIGVSVGTILGLPAIRAYVDALFLPSVSVTGLDSPDVGLATEAGLIAEPPTLPLHFSIRYRLERYDFPASASSRLEQFDQLMIAAGLRLGR